jgi:hypothetical protein
MQNTKTYSVGGMKNVLMLRWVIPKVVIDLRVQNQLYYYESFSINMSWYNSVLSNRNVLLKLEKP